MVTLATNNTNGTSSLNDLSIVDVQSKNYTNSSLPLWGIEIADGNYTIEDINLFWGLVDDSKINVSVIQTSRAAEIYLPATTHSITFGGIFDSFASGIAFSAAWNSVYGYAAAVRGTAIDFIPRCTSLHLRQLSTFANTLSSTQLQRRNKLRSDTQVSKLVQDACWCREYYESDLDRSRSFFRRWYQDRLRTW